MVGEARLTTRDDTANSVDQRLETGASPVANWAPNQVLASAVFDPMTGLLVDLMEADFFALRRRGEERDRTRD